MTQRIYPFSQASCAGDKHMTALLGGKGANLAEMCQLGLPVPPGFTITTEASNQYRKLEPSAQAAFLDALVAEALEHVDWLTEQFGYLPLLSVRSGAPVSMPGMMDTILNVGLTPKTAEAWNARIGQRATLDCRRRLIQMLGSTAFGIHPEAFENELHRARKSAGVALDSELDTIAMAGVVNRFHWLFEKAAGHAFPDTLGAQLTHAIKAVFDSWTSPRATLYRRINGIDDAMGTAVNIQAMVFGNMGADSGTGVLFTRNAATGENELYGEFLQDAQGEDVVAGIRTPLPLVQMDQIDQAWSATYAEIGTICDRLEEHYQDMLDLEFTVQRGKLWLLQCRTGKRSALAAFRIAVDLVAEGLIDQDTALARLTPEQYKLVRRPRIADGFAVPPHATGIAASPGVASGKPVFSAEAAVNCSEPCIMITEETSPDDIAGMAAAAGVLTRTGGTTSHAAVVARAMDKPCVVGCTALDLDPKQWADVHRVTIDGATGRVWRGVEVPLVDGSADPSVLEVCRWAVRRSGYAVTTLPINAGSPVGPASGDSPVPDWEQRLMVADWWGDHGRLHQVLHDLAQLPSRLGITLDLAPPFAFGAAEDEPLQDCFGKPVPNDQEEVAAAFLLDLLKALVGRSAELEGLTLVFDSDPGEVLINGMKKHGFRIATSPATVADLLDGDVMAPDAGFIDTVIGGLEAWYELEAVFASAGRKLSVLAPGAPAEYLVFTQLGR